MFKLVASRIVESPCELDTVQRVSGRTSSRDVRARHGIPDDDRRSRVRLRAERHLGSDVAVTTDDDEDGKHVEPEPTDDDTPGFGAVVALIALVDHG